MGLPLVSAIEPRSARRRAGALADQSRHSRPKSRSSTASQSPNTGSMSSGTAPHISKHDVLARVSRRFTSG
jgi:hypothetical protein